MRNYKVILKLTGPITQVPDSQKLFGALMYMFAEKYGDERAADLASAVRNKAIHLALSNIMPEGYLPAPKDYLMDHISKKNNLAEELKKKHAAIKIRSYIKSQELEHVLAEPESSEFLFPYVTQLDLQQLHQLTVSAMISRNWIHAFIQCLQWYFRRLVRTKKAESIIAL